MPAFHTADVSVGVHSIERSAQEDMLLVLFNTAISNLVDLFRNNAEVWLTGWKI